MRKKAEEMAAKLPPIEMPVRHYKPLTDLPISNESWMDAFVRMFEKSYAIKPIINDEIREVVLAFNKKEMKKGICIAGTVGNGKTSIMRVISSIYRHTTSQFFDVYAVNKLARDYSEIGPKALKRAYTYPACLDDIGAEGMVSYMGNKINVSQELIIGRYDSGLLTNITTNLSPGELKEHLGDRAFDRLRQMCEIYVFTSESFRL